MGTEPPELGRLLGGQTGMLRQRARSACGTIPGPCASATRRAAFGAGRGDFSPGTSCIGGFTTPVQAFGSQDRLPASLRTGFVISLEKPRCRPHLPRVAEVPAPVDGAAFITERRVTSRSCSAFIIGACWRRATPSAATRRRRANEPHRGWRGPGTGSPQVCSGAIPAARLGAGGLGGGGRAGEPRPRLIKAHPRGGSWGTRCPQVPWAARQDLGQRSSPAPSPAASLELLRVLLGLIFISPIKFPPSWWRKAGDTSLPWRQQKFSRLCFRKGVTDSRKGWVSKQSQRRPRAPRASQRSRGSWGRGVAR